MKLIINMKYKQSHRNLFSKGIHDWVTLANHKKCHSVALQFIDPFLEKEFGSLLWILLLKQQQKPEIAYIPLFLVYDYS